LLASWYLRQAISTIVEKIESSQIRSIIEFKKSKSISGSGVIGPQEIFIVFSGSSFHIGLIDYITYTAGIVPTLMVCNYKFICDLFF
jgi:hypothetical protein